MRYYAAPLEGATTDLYRRLHQQYFGGADKYFTPFLSPNQNHSFNQKELREVLPEHNRGLPVVPQLLTRVAEDFIWAAAELRQLGYGELNLNLGCPSGTVVAKGKGSGLLGRGEELRRFLDDIFAAVPGPISVKTRLGLREDEEFYALLELFESYPIAELTLHPRVQKDFYKGKARRTYFGYALERGRLPLCYNGDLVTAADCRDFCAAYPGTEALMLGRGLLADPAVFRKLRGGKAAAKAEIEAFVTELYEGYAQAFGSRQNAVMRMKDLWHHQFGLFTPEDRLAKKLYKAGTPGEYEAAVSEVFARLSLGEDAQAIW